MEGFTWRYLQDTFSRRQYDLMKRLSYLQLWGTFFSRYFPFHFALMHSRGRLVQLIERKNNSICIHHTPYCTMHHTITDTGWFLHFYCSKKASRFISPLKTEWKNWGKKLIPNINLIEESNRWCGVKQVGFIFVSLLFRWSFLFNFLPQHPYW